MVRFDKKGKLLYINNIMGLIVNEIFCSIQGESSKAGFRSVFVRLTGCNLNCHYCDTEYAKKSGEKISIDKIIDDIKKFEDIDHITITGGEPLLQPKSIILMKRLLDLDYSVQLETNGSINLKDVPQKVRKIVDIKTLSSGEAASFLIENLKFIDESDEIKFVISDIDDYHYSRDYIEKNLRDNKGIINFSPVPGMMSSAKLSELILVDRLQVRLNLQLHKIIWPDGEPKINEV